MSARAKFRSLIIGNSIRWQIGILYTILALINIVFFSVMIFENQTDLLIENFKLQSGEIVNSVIDDLSRLKITRQKNRTLEELRVQLLSHGINSFTIFDAGGDIWHRANGGKLLKKTKNPKISDEIRRKSLEIGHDLTLYRKEYHLEMDTDAFNAKFILPLQSAGGTALYLYTNLKLRSIDESLRKLYYQAGLAIAWGIVFHVLFGVYVARILFRRIARLTDAAGEMAQGDLSARASWVFVRNDELDRLGQTFNTMAEKIQETIVEVTRLNEEIQNELEVGKEVQSRFIPEKEIREQFKASVFYHPMREVSGDIYNLHELAGNRKSLFFADASGHGVSAALITSIASLSLDYIMMGGEVPEVEMIFDYLNDELNRRLNPTFYMSAVLFIFGKKREFQYMNAGHPPPLVLRPDTGEIFELNANVPVLGIIQNVKYEREVFNSKRGDKLLIYSDGLTETENDAEEPYSIERVKKILTKHRKRERETLLKKLMDDFHDHIARYMDDVSVILLEL